jgi:hypothetical protein
MSQPPFPPSPGFPQFDPQNGAPLPPPIPAIPIDYRVGTVAGTRTSAASIISLIFGILGCVPLLTGAVAITTGIIGIRATRDPSVKGRGMAIAGLILGSISICLWGLLFSIWLLSFAGSSAPRTATHQFIANLSSGSISAAGTQSTNNITPAQLQAAANLLQSEGGAQQTRIFGFNYNSKTGVGTHCGISGSVTTMQGKLHTFRMQWIEQNGVWKLNTYSMQ